MQIIECVPNISEGRDAVVLEKIANAIRSVKGVQLLNVDSGEAANRTVFTFVGAVDAVLEAAYKMHFTAAELLSMKNHKGEHPRLGLVDVCPFIPVQNINAEELNIKVQNLAERVSKIGYPVYFYEQSSTKSYRKRLEQIRFGEYEGLCKKLQNPDWKPDFGSVEFNADLGATVIGVRNFLLAYNVNLSTKDVQIAKNIAAQIRESGGKYIDPKGNKNHCKQGMLQGIKAIGWYIKDFDMVQVSTNITDFRTVGIATVFEQIVNLAKEYDVEVLGSELIGLIPYDAIAEAGKYFKSTRNQSETNEIETAINVLGLRQIKPFEPETQILEIVAGLK